MLPFNFGNYPIFGDLSSVFLRASVVFDPQTAGGCCSPRCRSDAAALLTALTDAGVPAVEIGAVLPAGKPLIKVV